MRAVRVRKSEMGQILRHKYKPACDAYGRIGGQTQPHTDLYVFSKSKWMYLEYG